MSQQDPNNIQLNCSSCRNAYLIQAQFQASPHQCPHCGVMQGQSPLNPTMPMQPPGLAPAAGYGAPGQHQPAAKSKNTGSRVVFIIRCIVGVAAVIAIICTLMYVAYRKANPEINLGPLGLSEMTNSGNYERKRGGSITLPFKATTSSGEAAKYEFEKNPTDNATITESGVFNWKVPKDAEYKSYQFVVKIWDPKDAKSRGLTRFTVAVIE